MSGETKLLDVEDVTTGQDSPAGGFSAWLDRTRAAQRAEDSVDVPCGTCNACCKSSYFIHIAPDESDTLRRIPKRLLFAAPGLPAGNVLMGYDEDGRCPMLIDEKCSIYADRPRTCRTYDCRVFPAAGIEAGDRTKERLDQRARRWKFSYPTARDRQDHAAVQAAAAFLRDHDDCFPAGALPGNPTQLAVLAVMAYDVFVHQPGDRPLTNPEIVDAVMTKKEQFGASRRR
jgi:Fe-S-cluster containining protein